MLRWVGAQEQVNLDKKAKTFPIVTQPTENLNPKQIFFCPS